MQDVYTLQEISNRSKEHIIPNHLGGRRTSNTIIDKSTNDHFGSTMDAELGRAINWIRILLDARSGDGTPPPPLSVESGAETYLITPGGKPELRKPGIHVNKDPVSGTVTISGVARNEQEVRRLTKRVRQQYGISDEALAQALERQKAFVPPVSIQFQVNSLVLRSIAKIACNLFSSEHTGLFLRHEFNGVREYILNGGDDQTFIRLNTSEVSIGEAGRDLGPLDHLVLVHGDSETGQVRALVCLFKYLQFVVDMGTIQLSDDIALAYRVDQLGRQQRMNDQQDIFEIPRVQRPLDVERALKSAMGSILHVIQSRLPNIIEEISRTAVEEVFADKKEGDPFTAEDSTRLVNKLVTYMLQAGLFAP